MRRDAREEWKKRVERWADSGLSAKEFAAETGINANSLGHWKWRLNAEQRGVAPKRAPRATFVEIVAPFMGASAAQVPKPPDAKAESGPEPLEVVLRDGLRVRVPARFDPDALRRVVAALEAR